MGWFAIARARTNEFRNLAPPPIRYTLRKHQKTGRYRYKKCRELPSDSRDSLGGTGGARLQFEIRTLEKGTGARRTISLTRAYRCVYRIRVRLPHALCRSCGSWDLGLECGFFE